MNLLHWGTLRIAAGLSLTAMSLVPAMSLAQNTTSASTSTAKEQWIHVRVESKDNKGETVRVNVPIEMAEKVLPAINKNNLHDGKLRIDSAHMGDVDMRAVLDAVRTAKDGEYVTVQSNEDNVRVAKSAGYLYIHVTENGKKATGKESAKASPTKESRVEVKVPMKVVDALFSAGDDELNVVAALRALSANGDTELVSVKDDENTVRVWIDSKNIAD